MPYNNFFGNNCGCNRCDRCCCQGPRGPQGQRGAVGPPGIAETITVRNTTTGEAETQAQVVDVSGSPNHVLDFVIPRGAAGADGAPGADGADGIDGVSDRISIEETITGDAGTPASVEDDFTMGVHHLTFTIPKGEDAPANQQSMAQLYTTTAQTLNTVGQIFDFAINQNFRNSLTTQQTVQVLAGGTYKIEFGFVFSSATTVVMSLYVNGAETVNTRLSFSDTMLNNHASVLIVLNANDELSVRVQQITGAGVLQNGVLNGYLILTPAG